MIYPDELDLGNFVIFVNDTDNKNYLVKIESKGMFTRHQHLYPSSARFIVSHLYLDQLFKEANPVFSLYMFRGIEITTEVTACFLIKTKAFSFEKNVLYHNEVLYSAQPIFLHQFQKIYFEYYNELLPVDNPKLKVYIDQLRYQRILNPHTNAYIEPLLIRDEARH